MSQFLFYYTGKGPKPVADVARVRMIPGVVVINDSLPRSVVLEVSDNFAQQLLRGIATWKLHASQDVELDSPVTVGRYGTRAPRLRLV
jgi:hypothetical protein